MSSKTTIANDRGFLDELRRELGDVWRALIFAVSSGGPLYRNWIRRVRRLQVDFVVMPVGGSLPERSGPPRSFWQRQLPLPPVPLSMETLNDRLAKIADASNVRGVLFVFQGFSAGIATLSNFRRSIERLKQAGKETVVFTPYLDLLHYFAATAADQIIVPPSASFDVLGIRSEAVFLKDALDHIGIKADVIQISPYKTAYDSLVRSNISPEQREQLEWILDDTYDVITQAMADGRSLEKVELLGLIDQAPFLAEKALESRLVDHISYEDSLPYLLVESESDRINESAEASSGEDLKSDSTKGRKQKKRAKIVVYDRARNLMFEKKRRPLKKYIGVINLEGLILMGPSRRPPISLPIPIPFMASETAGEETISHLIRLAERDTNLAALILHVDSPGGLSLASDLIWRQIVRLTREKPVLAFFGNTAASGGYYVGAGAQHIMGSPLTVTGSIGVLAAHFSTQALYDKLNVSRIVVERGKNVGMLSDAQPLSSDQIEIIWQNVVLTYEQFKEVVANSRNLPLEELDDICNGRVWTGRQALQHRLIDSHGDFVDAVTKIAELADIEVDDDHELLVWNIHSKRDSYLPPKPLEPLEELVQFGLYERLVDLQRRSLAIMPFELKFR